MTLSNKIKGCLIGGALGDALGYPIEFKTEDDIRRIYGDKGITELPNPGCISDDTQMTLFTCEGILKSDGDIISSIYQAYQSWLKTQNVSKSKFSFSLGKTIEVNTGIKSDLLHIPELNIRRSPGDTCISALLQNRMGTIARPLNDSKGCGGVMRAAPLGFLESPMRLGCETAAITHGHPGGYIPAGILADIVHQAVYTNFNLQTIIDNSFNNAMTMFPYPDITGLYDKAMYFLNSGIPDKAAINAIGKGWTGDEALIIAIYSVLKHKNNVRDALICAVNHDGDSDSTGAIAGNIIGAYLGYEAMPKDWECRLELKNVILTTAEKLALRIQQTQE